MTTLYRGGRVRAPADPHADALLVDGSVLAWVGHGYAAGPADDVVDLGGALLTPAFVDAHVHSTSTGLALLGLDLSGAASLGELLSAVERAARASGGRPLLGHGWDESRWPERRPPSTAELDRAAYGGVVYLSRVDVHSAVVSSALLAAAPLVRTLPGWSESGQLTRDAHHAARRVARDALTAGQRRDAQRATLRAAASLGVGCLHELAGPDLSGVDDLTALVRLAGEEPGPEVLPYWGEPGPSGVDTAAVLGALGAAGDVFADGSIGSHTACFAEPYADRPGERGHQYLSAEEIRDHVLACTRAGLQAGFHAIGDAAVAAVAAGMSAAATQVGEESFRRAGHRVEHLELIPDGVHAELARLGVLASVQPAFDALWGGESGLYAERLGVDRALASNPLATLAAAGVRLAFGSDAPVTPLAPWEAVRAAVHHHSPASRLDPEAAFAAHTAGGWAAARRRGGELVPGAPATFAVWDAEGLGEGGLPDLAPGTAVPACLRTVVNGRTIWEVDQ
ncbi:MAG TPA: amidohydrolase family protein [Mycobacteriales bacterium]|nr:amidohydrolase family protein [Mycobacteriales bacterium]